MNLETALSHFKKYRNIYLFAGLALFLIIFFSLLYRGCDDYMFWLGIEKDKANVNAALNTANQIEKEIDNLNRQSIEQGAEVNQKKLEHNRAMEESDNQDVIINAQKAVINAIETQKQINANLAEVNRNRCLAFPQDKGC